MLKNLEAKPHGSPAERAAYLLIYYFRAALGTEAFRDGGGDLEAEICSIVKNTVNQAVSETCRQITQNQREQLICHIEDARLHLDEFARQGHYTPKTQALWLAVSDLADAMKQIVTRLV